MQLFETILRLKMVCIMHLCNLLLHLTLEALVIGQHFVKEFVFELRKLGTWQFIFADLFQSLGYLAVNLRQDLECLRRLFCHHFILESAYFLLDDLGVTQSIFLRFIGLFSL